MKIKVLTLIWLFSMFLIQGDIQAGNNKQAPTSVACTYIVRSISKPVLAGINLSRGINFSVISEVGGILAGNTSTVPLDFTMNLNIENKNQFKIALVEMEYILRVDNIELTRGTIKKKVSIGAGKTKAAPIPINVDLAKLIRSNSGNALQNMVKNFMRTGVRPSKVMLQIKPSYRVGKETLTSQRYIPLSFSFGGQ